MRALRWIGTALGLLVLALALTAFAARFADGPFGVLPGGPLTSGTLAEDPGDWSFVGDIEEVELQLVEPPRSRTTWIVYHEGDIYVPCGFLDVPLFKQWPYDALEDGRAVLRVLGVRYERRLVKVEDKALHATLGRLNAEKYGFDGAEAPDPETVWFFRLDPR